MTVLEELSLSPDLVNERRQAVRSTRQLVFGVGALYGLSTHSIPMPLNETESIDSGQVCLMGDADAGLANNVGILDFERCKMRVRYAVQAVFPGLYRLITSGRFDTSLLNPIRATATDECSLTADYSGWRALGCLEFLPGSLWAGAHGG
jgi:hypothetical protein